MATRQQRLDAFTTDDKPPAGKHVEVLCEDHNGAYVLPYLCHWQQSAWHNVVSGHAIEVTVLGWREPSMTSRSPCPTAVAQNDA